MWCTRWFLPLLLLPLPTAPPYFLVLFLFTLALHARPCFYCIILLAALFLSSCYWQSFPLHAPLSAPWADNITTFREALNASVSQTLDMYEVAPPIIRVSDRCWCDFAFGVFEPYDVQKWERDSVERAVAEIENQLKTRLENRSDETKYASTLDSGEAGSMSHSQKSPEQRTVPLKESLFILRSLFGRGRSNDVTSMSTSNSPQTSQTTSEDPAERLPPVEASAPDNPLFPGQLDLRPHGFDVILDFRWSRTA
ncbi:hypothetical protein M404DRAFT_409811 [Pisolithus tinctorius Marx 270]|uniref:Uncharacterized protein n=1 Tax=Pisolithus tinctorius Marx 270 TaxID=870435 RepID=A0A0C3PGD8_PISTI|nr:hypothetical protein M404DRAFT_409811 [Pisolithus tinctorius Marx 270]